MSQMDAQSQKLVDGLREENQKHEQAIEEENQRHEEKVEDIKQKAGLYDLKEDAEQIRSEYRVFGGYESDIKKLVFSAINTMSRKQRVSIDETITIRDDSVYRYDRSKKAKLTKLMKPHIQRKLKKHIKDNQMEEFEQMIEQLNRLDIESGHSSKDFGHAVFIDEPVKTTDRYDDIVELNVLIYNTRNHGKVQFTNAEEDADLSRLHTSYGDEKIRFTTEDPDELENILKHKDKLQLCMVQTREKMQKVKDRREEVYENLQEILSKQLMMQGLK